jgi:hypothetical protein
MNKIALCVPAVFLFAVSCGFAPYFCNFSPLDAHHRSSASGAVEPVAVSKVPDSSVSRCRISDSLVDITFSVTMYQIEFSLKNKTGKTLTVDWEKAAYINPRGERRRVIHGGIVYAQKNVAQHSSRVYKGETLSDFLLPSENINVYLYGSGGWSMVPIFSNSDVGKTAQVVFPVEIGGVTNEYTVRFVINSV